MDQTARIKQLEARLLELERQQNQEQSTPAMHSTLQRVEGFSDHPAHQRHTQQPQPKRSLGAPAMTPIIPYAASVRKDDAPMVTKILGFGGAASIILACVYLLRLAYDYGVFTPERQLYAALFAGLGLLVAGLWLQQRHGTIASYLASSGLVVMFFTVGAAFHTYQVIEKGPALSAFALLLGIAVWLEMFFRSSFFAFVAVLAAYLMPSVIPDLVNTTSGAVTYLGGCALGFSMYALMTTSRSIYISAMYLGFVMLAWYTRGNDDWRALMGYQLIQFGIFSATAMLFSLVKRRPMNDAEAWAHLPALVIFYIVQILTLKAHAPQAIPWVSAGSAIFLVLLYQVARIQFQTMSSSIQAIVVGYAAIATIHGVYIESVPDQYAPWVGLLSGPLVIFLLKSLRKNSALFGPLLAATLIGFIYNNIRIMFVSDGSVPNADALRILYAAQLWGGFYLLRKEEKLRPLRVLSLYAGHIQAMAACVAVLSNRLEVSFAWAAIALCCLTLGVVSKSKEVGSSALILLAASGAKAAFYDLDDSQPVLRVGCLAVLGISLFASGWLYTKLERVPAARAHIGRSR